MHIDIAALTSKGQFTLPRKFRDLLRLAAGSKMVIACDGEHLLLKPIKQQEAQAFRPLIRHLRELEARTKKAVK
ncbi:MAG: AbrB/MazE/SpoVT family DNA-binding domain-containing protein [Kiritimatiellia bacterium]|nr:AbrB/MazE/SpoVT family DNA-binding domain-containing protein [Kiritimatiellia bacterium]